DILQDLYSREQVVRNRYETNKLIPIEDWYEYEEMVEIKEVELPVGAGDAFTDDRVVAVHHIPGSQAMGANYKARVRGQSMDPIILDGDYILVRKQDFLEHSGQLIVAHIKNIGTTVKFAFKRENEVGLGKSLTTAKWYPDDEVAVCGIVVKIERPPNIIERLEQEALEN
ncbi:MAG: hypothetical protein J7M18_05480, partial [Candidatus Eremiobacteraeota bacterium]|nr:hypothetical protein [Candidatus Eremiobacteraeota bacterium]